MLPLQKFISVAAIVTLAGQVIFLANLFWSLLRGPAAEANPWQCTSLEWTLPSPVPQNGFAGRQPQVNHGPYEYRSGAEPESDFVMQNASADGR
jgi:cytochrome c oxidase subunit 1